ncbi:mechanosensitive ion channel domain-containing protein [Methylocystis sp. JAN1]|uniref:mechanosensitive ion channel domain-containing protein n=1 Tax=Methylocystis sp. JAN1 TaxID=3397211 RepID=UPI003FA2DDD7
MRRPTLSLALLLATLFVTLAAVMARADEAPTTLEQVNARLDRTRATLDEAHKTLEDPNLHDGALRLLRERLEPLRRELEETIDALTPRLAAVEARLKELAPAENKPAEAKPAEQPAPAPAPPAQAKAVPSPPARPASPPPANKPDPARLEAAKTMQAAPPPAESVPSAEAAASAELVEQRRVFDAIDATLKRARAMLLETRQLSVAVVARQRDLFAKTLFLRTNGLFSIDLWRSARADAPIVFSAATSFLADRATNFASRVESRRIEFVLLVALILLALPPAFILSRRVLARDHGGQKPTPIRRAAAAAWTALVAGVVPIAGAAALGAVLEGFDLLDATLEPLWRRVFEAVARVAFVYGAARAIFAPTHPDWRVIDPGDRLAKLAVRLLTTAAVILSITRLIEQIEETVQASLPVVIVTRGVGVMAVAALLLWTIVSLAPRRAEAGDEAAATGRGRDWLMVVRLICELCLLLILGASLAGYVTFANFVIMQVAWTGAVAFLLYVFVVVGAGGAEHAFSADGLLGRSLINGLGVKRERLAPIGVLLAGVVTILIWIAAGLVALAPFGYESNDILANVRSAFFSFKIGDVTVSPSAAITAVGLFLVVLAAVQGFRRWLDTRLLPLTRLDVGLRSAINSTLGYAGVIGATLTAASSLGIGVERLAIVAGALSVGIGFGLQSIVSNFVSGLILLWERVIRVGDWVVVGDEQGYVRRINVRSTEIETFDRATMIVPNSNLVSGVVKNWLRGDRVGRIKVAISPHPGVDPEQIRDIMLVAARAQEGVLRIPAPQVMFLGMEASGFKFELWCYVEDVEKSSRVRSDLHFDLHRRLSEAGVKIAPKTEPPKTILELPELDKLAAAAAASALAIETGIVQLASPDDSAVDEPQAKEMERTKAEA